jgi:hypothetical protein
MPDYNRLIQSLGGARQGQDLLGLQNSLIQQGNQSGAFSPTGSPLVMALAKRQAQTGAESQIHRGDVMGRLLGLNPYEQRGQLLNVGNDAAGNAANALNSAQYGQASGGQDFIRQMFGQRLGFEQQKLLQYLAQKQAQKQQGGFGSMFGGLLGQGLGALVPGLGGLFGGGQQAGSGGGQWY